ncbi:ribonuclease HI [Thermosynechococcaceae cyanobacterium Okahandja]
MIAANQTVTAIYTDGACEGNPGPGGWAVVMYLSDGSVHELGGGHPQTTNNRMELKAAIEALKLWRQLNQKGAIALYTDSEYVLKGITEWIHNWKRRGWQTAAKKPVLNQDLWQELDALNAAAIRWQHVRGHSGNVGNERCDAIARSFSRGQPIALRQHPALLG